MRGTSAKILLGFLVVALIAPTLFVARPQKAEALISLAQCIVAKTTAGTVAGGAAGVSSVLSVSVSDIVNTVTTAQGPAGQDWVACFMKGLVKIIAKTLLHTFTQSIVNWINTGFQGSPSFITNPEGFLNDVADQTIGRVIEDISPFLCAPFRLDIRFALGLNLSLNTKDEIHCRLSDVIANVRGAYDGFVQGAVGSGNLSRWIHIAGTQQNNPYGAYIATTNKLSIGITTATGQQIKLLDWGKGFRSWRSCKKWGPDVRDASNHVVRKGACIEEGPIKTPGSIIQDQTTGALGTTLRELELADEIDEIVGALINQLLVKAITGAGGLLGASKGSITSGGRSAADSLLTDPERALAISDAVTPDGIDCRLRYYPSTTAVPSGERLIYVADDIQDQVWTDNLGVGKTVGVVVGDVRPIVEAKYNVPLAGGLGSDTLPVTKPREGTPGGTWREYFNRVREGCANQFNTLITDASATGRDTYTERTVDTSLPTPPLPPTRTLERRQISLWEGEAGLNQSFINIDGNFSNGPQNAAGGFGLSDTEDGPLPHWWTASLKKPEMIKVVVVKFRAGYPMGSIIVGRTSLENMGIPITPADVTEIVYSFPSAENATTVSTRDSVTITFTEPIEATALVISSSSSELKLTSVKMYRPAETVEDTR